MPLALRLAIPLVGAMAAAATGAAAAFAMDGGPRQHLSEQTGLKLCRSGQIERRATGKPGAQQFILRSGPRDACKKIVARSLARAAADQCPDPSASRGGCAFGFGARTVTVVRYESGRGRSDRYLVRTS